MPARIVLFIDTLVVQEFRIFKCGRSDIVFLISWLARCSEIWNVAVRLPYLVIINRPIERTYIVFCSKNRPYILKFRRWSAISAVVRNFSAPKAGHLTLVYRVLEFPRCWECIIYKKKSVIQMSSVKRDGSDSGGALDGVLSVLPIKCAVLYYLTSTDMQVSSVFGARNKVSLLSSNTLTYLSAKITCSTVSETKRSFNNFKQNSNEHKNAVGWYNK